MAPLMNHLRHRLRVRSEWRPGSIATGTFAMTAGMGLRTIGQVGVFLLVARMLGVQAYGAYAAVLAIAGALGGFGGFGTHMLMQRDLARGRSAFARVWGRTLAIVALSTPILLGLYLLLAWAVLPARISWVVVLSIGIAEILFAPIVLGAINAYQGHDRIGRAARLVLVPVIPRLVAAVLLFGIAASLPTDTRLVAWSVMYVLAALCAAAYALFRVRRDLGFPSMPDVRELYTCAREGGAFAFGGAALKLYADLDKTLVARLATLEAAGTYSAGYRVVDMATIPMTAMLAATMPKVFRAGENGLGSALRYGWQILPVLALYAVLIGGLLFWAAPLLPIVLGEGFRPAVTALHWLCWLPLISLPRLLLQSLLIGADKQRTVTLVLSVGVLLNVLLNVGFILLLGWRGAVISTYFAEVTMSLGLFLLLQRYRYHGGVCNDHRD
jgi:O-antigen/teichoic acid export membrane protein